MIEIKGRYNTAICYTTDLDEKAEKQIRFVCDEEAFLDSRIRIMPDVHAGKGCTIGTTMTVKDRVVPNMVGVDIGCGMETVRLRQRDIDFKKLDTLIRKVIPCGREIRRTPHEYNAQIELEKLRCAPYVNLTRAAKSIGTLGGGNHFIEVDRAKDGELYLIVHSGSRHLGFEVANYYQEQGLRALWGGARRQIERTIETLKAQGRFQEIEATLAALKKEHETERSQNLVCVQGELFEDYIHDMRIVQRFAELNRRAMTNDILCGMGLSKEDEFTTIHNYIDTESMILRKGAVSARAGERLLIPINMRDGSLICTGKGNPEWNCSAPHGAGRLMSRKQALASLSVEEYREQMKGVYTTCVAKDTLDEAPMAYKSMATIIEQIGPTAQIVEHITPVYNFKAAE
ncbi:MAG: RtcB family protein [Clostridia bacterium]|nr:RtcB family protein [Clostridia bacterium]